MKQNLNLKSNIVLPYQFSDTFEVTINGKLIFSKLKEKKYPDLYNIVDEAVKVSEGGEPEYVEDKQCLTGPLAYLNLCWHTLLC